MNKPPRGFSKTPEYKYGYGKGYHTGKKRVDLWYVIKRWLGLV